MDFRSTNDNHTHYQGDLVSNVTGDSSHGCHLTGGSTGAIFTAAGDEANVAITLAGKGTGYTRIGNSSSPATVVTASTFVVSSGAVLQVGSTAPFAGLIRQNSSFQTPDFASTNKLVMDTTHVMTGVNSSHYVIANGVNLSTDAVIVGAYASASTAGDVHVWLAKVSTLAVTVTSATIRLLVHRF